jgi:hypothetical protein
MFTDAAARSLAERNAFEIRVMSVAALISTGWTAAAIRAQVRAGRWQRIGRAIILHNTDPTRDELVRAAVIVLGPRAVETAFTALESWGLQGWQRDEIHILVPRGARVTRPKGLSLRIHYTDRWDARAMNLQRSLHRPATAAVRAAGSFAQARPACGVLAATVQQRLVRPSEVVRAVADASRTRHRATLLAAAHDIAGGAHALSEIDFARLCRAAGLAEPARQAIRLDRFGRRRYLDVEWRLRDGRRVVAEIDGALHLAAQHWWADQLRQNEFTIAGDLVLRFPSAVVRCEKALVVGQLRRMGLAA